MKSNVVDSILECCTTVYVLFSISFNFTDGELKQLKTDLKKSHKKAYADSSRRNLRIQMESFMLFCTYFGCSFMPVSTETLQLYAQFLSRSFKSVDSIKNYISGVKSMYLLLGHSEDHINNYLLNLSLKLHSHRLSVLTTFYFFVLK